MGRVRFTLSLDRDRSPIDEDGSETAVGIHPNWQYASATLQVSVPSFVGLDDDEIADILIHELVHYWIYAISRYGSSREYDMLEERICTEIAQSIRRLLETAEDEVSRHWRKKVKGLEKELKDVRKSIPVPAGHDGPPTDAVAS